MQGICESDQVTEIYSPEVIARWLRRWELLDGLVQSPATSRHHLDRYHNRTAKRMIADSPCEPVTSGAGVPSLNWAEFRADIELGISRLTDDLERNILLFVINGGTLTEAARELHKQKTRVLQAFHSGVDHCAQALGWRGVHVHIEQTDADKAGVEIPVTTGRATVAA